MARRWDGALMTIRQMELTLLYCPTFTEGEDKQYCLYVQVCLVIIWTNGGGGWFCRTSIINPFDRKSLLMEFLQMCKYSYL